MHACSSNCHEIIIIGAEDFRRCRAALGAPEECVFGVHLKREAFRTLLSAAWSEKPSETNKCPLQQDV